MGSWERVGGSSSFMGLVSQSIRPSNADGSMSKLWVGDGEAISWARVGCGTRSTRSISGVDIPSDSVSLVHIYIRVSSERCGFFSVRVISYGDRLVWE